MGATVAGGVLAGVLAIRMAPPDPLTPGTSPSVAPTVAAPRRARRASSLSSGGLQPVAIFHAFDQSYRDVGGFVCDLAGQGYSHVQIAPAQKSNPSTQWWARYQPVDYARIEGRGSEDELQALVEKAHGCGIRVIADVVFNHMAKMDEFRGLGFPGLSPSSFHPPCRDPSDPSDGIDYRDGNRQTEIACWLGNLPDLDQERDDVQAAQQGHVDRLLDLGIDGFRFDAAKHMSSTAVRRYIDYVNAKSNNGAWNYLEVIGDADTRAEDYNAIAAVTDFELYRSMKRAFSFGGDLRTLRVAAAVDDARSVTFGRNHDTIREINDNAIDPYSDRVDSWLATAYVLAREGGTPLVLNWDNADGPFVRFGVKFRSIVRERASAGANVKENVLAVVDNPTLLVMERGTEGWFIVNKATAVFDVPALDLTLTHLEGCYRELRNDFVVAVERRGDGRKWITRWGSANRGGLQVQGRDALFLVRDPWERCQAP